VNEFAV